jgi:hypothetical protein
MPLPFLFGNHIVFSGKVEGEALSEVSGGSASLYGEPGRRFNLQSSLPTGEVCASQEDPGMVRYIFFAVENFTARFDRQCILSSRNLGAII